MSPVSGQSPPASAELSATVAVGGAAAGLAGSSRLPQPAVTTTTLLTTARTHLRGHRRVRFVMPEVYGRVAV
jgi:hypothetical protein